MTKTQLELASISMDLKRVSLGLYRNSNLVADRFSQEIIKRSKKLPARSLKPYIRTLVKNLTTMLSQKDKQKVAEDALMYSTLFQNSVLESKGIETDELANNF